MTIQPPEQDSHIDQRNDDVNYEKEVELVVKSRTNRAIRSLVQFDISSLPSGIDIGSAVIELYVTGTIPGSTRTYNAHRLQESWTEGGVTWLNRNSTTAWSTFGGDFAASTDSAIAGTSTYVWISWNITEDVRGWYNGTYPNYGTLIKDSAEDTNVEIHFVSRDNTTDPTLRPKLIVNYTYLPDLNPPLWQNQNQSTDTPNVDDEVILSAQGKDDVAISYAVLETDETGTPENKTGVYGSPMYLGDVTDTWVWSNFTWVNESVPDSTVVTWRIWYNDSSGRWNVTDSKSFTVTLVPGPPKWRYQSQSDDEPYEGQEVILSAQGYDESDLSWAWLETNETGVYRNYTGANAAYGSPMYLGGGPGWKWSNFTWRNSSVKQGETVRWRIWYNDSQTNVSTNWKTFLVTEPKIILQPSDKDSYIDERRPDRNSGGDDELRVKSRTAQSKRSLVQFDLSSVSLGLSIDYATLELYVINFPNILRTYNAHRLTSGWTEGTGLGGAADNDDVTWDSNTTGESWLTAGGDYTPTETNSTQAGLDLNVWVAWNITSDVRKWYNGAYQNYGTLIKDSVETDNVEIRFASKEYATTAYRPRLVIKFTPDTTPPRWRNQGWNASSANLTQINRTVRLFAQGTDESWLRYAWLETNETGTPENKSGVYGSPMYLGGDDWTWSNFTWRNPSLSPGTNVVWRIYYNDSAGNINGTDIYNFTMVSWDSYCDANFQTPCEQFQNFSGTAVYMAGYGYPPNTDFDVMWFYSTGGQLALYSPVRSNASGWLNSSYNMINTEPAAENYRAVVNPLNKAPAFGTYDPTDPEIIADDPFEVIAGVPEFGTMAIPIATAGAIYLWMRRRKQGGAA
jgi:hypothetical protein